MAQVPRSIADTTGYSIVITLSAICREAIGCLPCKPIASSGLDVLRVFKVTSHNWIKWLTTRPHEHGQRNKGAQYSEPVHFSRLTATGTNAVLEFAPPAPAYAGA
ncbi:MAG: hypothetical protein P8M22_05950 [Phycisphaerales bacterium]|nr:hypothetical protein [Phycisphaerales bacterium]